MIDSERTVANAWAQILGPDVSVRGADRPRAATSGDAGDAGRGANAGADSSTADASGRTIEDVITLSDGAQIVNLARGEQLSAQIRAESDPDKVRELVDQGRQDINRITSFFGEMFRTLSEALRLR